MIKKILPLTAFSQAPVFIETLQDQTQFLSGITKKEANRFKNLATTLNDPSWLLLCKMGPLKPIIEQCSKLMSIQKIRHELHTFLHCRKHSKTHSYTEKLCAGVLHCQWVNVFANRAKDPDDEHAEALTHYAQILLQKPTKRSKEDGSFVQGITQLMSEITEKFNLSATNGLALPFRTLSTVKQDLIRKNMIHTTSNIGLETCLTYSNIESKYNSISNTLTKLPVDQLTIIQEELELLTSRYQDTCSLDFYSREYSISKKLKDNETPNEYNALFDSCRNQLLVCGEYAQLCDEIIDLLKSFDQFIKNAISQKKCLEKQQTISQNKSAEEATSLPKEKKPTNPWIKAKGTTAHIAACGAQKKGLFNAKYNKPLLSGLNEVDQSLLGSTQHLEPSVDDENKKLASKKKAIQESTKTRDISIENELRMAQFENSEYYLNALDSLILLYNQQGELTVFSCKEREEGKLADLNQSEFKVIDLDPFSTLKQSLNQVKKETVKTPKKGKKKGTKKKSQDNGSKSIYLQFKKTIKSLLTLAHEEPDETHISKIDNTSLKMVFNGYDLYIGSLSELNEYNGTGFLVSYKSPHELSVGIGIWNNGDCEGLFSMSNLDCKFSKGDGSNIYISFGLDRDVKWGALGQGRQKYSSGTVCYGTWGDIGNGQWDFVGEVRIEYPDGSNVYGTFEKQANGKWEFNKTKSSSS